MLIDWRRKGVGNLYAASVAATIVVWPSAAGAGGVAPSVEVTQLPLEYAEQQAGAARVSQLLIEHTGQTDGEARVTQLLIEILWPSSVTLPGGEEPGPITPPDGCQVALSSVECWEGGVASVQCIDPQPASTNCAIGGTPSAQSIEEPPTRPPSSSCWGDAVNLASNPVEMKE